MAYEKAIICLANSRKNSGRCVAGIEIAEGDIAQWIRPVSSRPGGELSEHDRRYRDGTTANVLDVIGIRFLEPQQHTYQRENHLIDASCYWECSGKASFADIVKLVDRSPSPLWINGHSTYHGINDKIPLHLCAGFSSSLRLIQPNQTTICVGTESGYQGAPGKRRVRALFELAGITYKLQVTDPQAEEKYLAGADGNYDLPNAILCISLSEAFEGHSFKLVAAIIIS